MGDNIIIMSPGMMDQSTDCNFFFMFSSIFVIFFLLCFSFYSMLFACLFTVFSRFVQY